MVNTGQAQSRTLQVSVASGPHNQQSLPSSLSDPGREDCIFPGLTSPPPAEHYPKPAGLNPASPNQQHV